MFDSHLAKSYFSLFFFFNELNSRIHASGQSEAEESAVSHEADTFRVLKFSLNFSPSGSCSSYFCPQNKCCKWVLGRSIPLNFKETIWLCQQL